jgi:hypothetical protein
MKRRDPALIVGSLAILLGLLLLAQNLGLFGPLHAIIWAAAFGAGGSTLIVAAVRSPSRWWALIPGMGLVSIATLITLDTFAPAFSGRWGGAVFLGGLSGGFWGVYLVSPSRWWALIPGGAVASLAAVAALEQSGVAEPVVGAALFFGVALTFGLVYLVRGATRHSAWALIVAGVALLLGVGTISPALRPPGGVWPALLIVGGLVLLVRALRRTAAQGREESYDNTTLPQSH